MQLPAGSAPSPSDPSAASAPPRSGPATATGVPRQPGPGTRDAPSSPVPSPRGPSHARSRPLHWLVTAAALGGVLGGAALLEPAGATSAPSAERAAVTPGPDADTARYPMDCGPVEAQVVDRAAADLDGDGRAETVAVVRCAAGIGTPPSGVYVLAHPAGAGERPRIAETLVDPDEGMTVQDLAVRGRTISARLLGYSSPDVPRCCPDRARDVEWNWRGGKFVLRAAPPAGSV